MATVLNDPLILVFLKFPEPGKVKTRLAASIGAEAATIVYQRLVRETLATAHAAPGEIRILFDPPERQAEVVEWISGVWPGDAKQLDFQPQVSGDLGARLIAGFRGAFESGHTRVCAIGTDCVEITAEIYAETWEKLGSGADAIFGPTDDGGYYLIGLNRLDERIFDVPWSAPDTLEKSLERAAECGFETQQLLRLTDIDTIDEWSAHKAKIFRNAAGSVDEPLVFAPVYREKIWGGRNLEKTFDRKLPSEEPIGESWEIVDRPEAQSVVCEGAFAGLSLNDLWRFQREEIFGADARGERFPLLLKILDAQKDLSIQVHPPEAIASELGGESKSEMWYVADAEPGAKIYVGLKEEVSRDAFLYALKHGTVSEVVHVLEPKAGDFIFIPSGRLHSIGAGILIYEIQANSDTTYRVFDWNRLGLDGKPRDLHIEESIRCIDFSDIEPDFDQLDGKTLASCPEFRVDRFELKPEASESVAGDGKFAILTVVDGLIECGGHLFQPGDFFAIPASAGENCKLRTHAQSATILRTRIVSTALTLPEEQTGFYQKIRQKIQAWGESKKARDSRWIEYVLLAPDVFHLLCKLVADPEVPLKEKAKLGVAIAYFISPFDLMPEFIFGPIGYLDDLVLASWALNEVVNKVDPMIVRRHWAGDGDVLDMTKQLLAKADDMLGRGLLKRVRASFDKAKKEAEKIAELAQDL
ncbi:MAG: mannose-6-phosphate isomerase [Verrucomicrobiales bacterium]